MKKLQLRSSLAIVSVILKEFMIASSLTWLEINKKSLDHNIQAYRSIMRDNVKLGVVLKSNAYGHGISQLGLLCEQHPLVDWLCTVNITEALFLRNLGIKKPLLVLSILDNDIQEAIVQNIDLIVPDESSFHKIANAAQRLKKRAHIHLKVDTGLSRLGSSLSKLSSLAALIKALAPYISVRGIFTHLADSEQADHTFARYQLNELATTVKFLTNLNINASLVHAACSAAINTLEDPLLNFVRLGIGLYGLWPSLENKERILRSYPNFSLKPALSWFTKIIQIKEIETGSFVGYDRTFQAIRPTRLAILPVGYWDGFDRELSNKGFVLIDGYLAPIRGRIAMNMMMIDITDIINVTPDTSVMLLGAHEGVRAEDHAIKCNTINYEIVTRINPLLPRWVV